MDTNLTLNDWIEKNPNVKLLSQNVMTTIQVYFQDLSTYSNDVDEAEHMECMLRNIMTFVRQAMDP